MSPSSPRQNPENVSIGAEIFSCFVWTFAFLPVAVDVEFETAAIVEFEALAFPVFPFFPVALVVAATAVAVVLAGREISWCKDWI